MKISKSPQSPQSPQSERKKRNFFQRHLPGAAADAEQREGKGSPLSSPQVPNLIYKKKYLKLQGEYTVLQNQVLFWENLSN